MAQGLVNRLVHATPLSLGVVRAIVHATFLIAVLTTSFSALGELPVTILRPTGMMRLLPWGFYDRLLTPTGMTLLKGVLVLTLLCATLGLFAAISTKLSFLLVLFYQGLLRSFGHFNHDEMIAVYYLAILAFSPCGDDFSLDKRLRKKIPVRPSFVYSYPILFMWGLMAWVYFSSALIKLRVAGLKYLSPDNLPALAIFHSLDNMHDTHFQIAFSLPQIKSYLPVAVAVVLIWELLFPIVIFSRRWRWWMLGAGVVFHLATLFTMNIFFPFQLAMYLVFVDWNRVAAYMKRFDGTPQSPNVEAL